VTSPSPRLSLACPFDAIVIGLLDDCSDINWTHLDSVTGYSYKVLRHAMSH